MPKQIPKLNPDWVIKTRDYFVKFLKVTKFPHPDRNGTRGSEFEYPEWLIMFIAVLSVKCKIKEYTNIHAMAVQYWKIIIQGTNLPKKPISERQLRDRLKKICHKSRKPAMFIFQIFSKEYLD
jgi:hypothetical protein